MKITMAYYYLPSGRRVHRDDRRDRLSEDYGVAPDVKVELTGKQIDKYRKARREAGILHRGRAGVGTNDWEVYDAEKILASDPQLAVAALCLRAQLLAQALGIDPAVRSGLASGQMDPTRRTLERETVSP